MLRILLSQVPGKANYPARLHMDSADEESDDGAASCSSDKLCRHYAKREQHARYGDGPGEPARSLCGMIKFRSPDFGYQGESTKVTHQATFAPSPPAKHSECPQPQVGPHR